MRVPVGTLPRYATNNCWVSLHCEPPNSCLAKAMRKLQGWQLHRIMTEGLQSGEVRPLPFSIFPRDEMETAFRFLTKGKCHSCPSTFRNALRHMLRTDADSWFCPSGVHIGKALIQMAPQLHQDADNSTNIMRPSPQWTPEGLDKEGLASTTCSHIQSPLSVRPSWSCRYSQWYPRAL